MFPSVFVVHTPVGIKVISIQPGDTKPVRVVIVEMANIPLTNETCYVGAIVDADTIVDGVKLKLLYVDVLIPKLVIGTIVEKSANAPTVILGKFTLGKRPLLL